MSCSIDNLQFSNVSVIGVRRIYSTVHKMWKFKGDGGFLLTFVVNITPIYKFYNVLYILAKKHNVKLEGS